MPEITDSVAAEIIEQVEERAPEVDESVDAADVRQPSTRVMCCDQAA
jgi:hypothetical protein